MEKEKITELANRLQTIKKDKRPRLTEEQMVFAKELYKAHFTVKEAAIMLSFGYGCIASYWQKFKYAKVEKYDRFELIIERDYAND